jgi:hypothetical protein
MAPLAVFVHLDPLGIVFLVLHGGVIASLTHAARECDYVFHSWLFGGAEKKKA